MAKVHIATLIASPLQASPVGIVAVALKHDPAIITPANFATSATVVILEPGSVLHAVVAVRKPAADAAKRAWCAVFAPCAITAIAPIKHIASPRCRVGVAGFANRFAASQNVFPQ